MLSKSFCGSVNNRLKRGEIKGTETVKEDVLLFPGEKGGGSHRDHAKEGKQLHSDISAVGEDMISHQGRGEGKG